MGVEWLGVAILLGIVFGGLLGSLLLGASATVRHRRRAWTVLRRAAAFAALWWILTDGTVGSWPIGMAGVVLATALSLRMLPPAGMRFTITGVPRFLAFFVWHAMKSGVQVALMALRPRLDLHPAILEFDLHLPDDSARLFLASTLSLLPGTLSCGLDGSRLFLHVLDGRGANDAAVLAAEARVADLFRVAK